LFAETLQVRSVKVRLKDKLLIVTAETPEEKRELAEWADGRDDHAFWMTVQDEQTVKLSDLGHRADACREPINVISTARDPAIRLLSNFAETPFELDGRTYASVEGFWQGLKFPDAAKRREVAALAGGKARRAGDVVPQSETFVYERRTIRAGSPEHWQLMALACWAKFSQHAEARRALLATGARPLVHKTRRDSRSIPGVIMADIWMKVRVGLLKRQSDFHETP
jgi:predicted NAD-dependent protein-ADP-ribosyltransferase YbiA (DUF1768 family)